MKKILLTASMALILGACSSSNLADLVPDNRPNYKASTTINPLEIPPDLTQSSIDDGLSVSEFSATQNASLATYQNERNPAANNRDHLAATLKNIQSDGSVSWIEIDEKPATVFNNAKNFWLNNGLALSRVDSGIGIMETDWLAPRSNLPTSGISALIGRLISGLKDEGVRDKFRTRIDYDGQRSYIYVTHYGATEEQFTDTGQRVVTQTQSTKEGSDNYAWIADSRNPELEVEMLRRLNLYLIKSGKEAAAASSVRKSTGGLKFGQLNDGTPVLAIQADFNRAWLLLGIAIDRAGYDLSAQNRRKGLYTFAKVTERKVGFLIKEIERDIVTYQLGLSDQGKQQIAVVTSVEGRQPTPAESQSILQKISQKMQF